MNLTGSVAVTFSSIKSNVTKTAAVVVPAAAEVHAAIQAVLDEKPTWKEQETSVRGQGTCEFLERPRPPSDLRCGWSGRRRPCTGEPRGQAGPCTSGSLCLHDERCLHTPSLEEEPQRHFTCQPVNSSRRRCPHQTPPGWDTWSCRVPCSPPSGPGWLSPVSGSSA